MATRRDALRPPQLGPPKSRLPRPAREALRRAESFSHPFSVLEIPVCVSETSGNDDAQPEQPRIRVSRAASQPPLKSDQVARQAIFHAAQNFSRAYRPTSEFETLQQRPLERMGEEHRSETAEEEALRRARLAEVKAIIESHRPKHFDNKHVAAKPHGALGLMQRVLFRAPRWLLPSAQLQRRPAHQYANQ